jgi:hypothetical protein
MKNLLLAVCLFAIALVAGCSTVPPVIDLSGSAYRTSENATNRKSVSSIQFRNKAEEGKLVNGGIGGSVFPIIPATTTRQTVESDMRSFFGEAIFVDPSSKRSLLVTISKADSYWVFGAMSAVPFLGLLTVGADTEFGMNVRVLVEVEEGEKVVSSYTFDEKITVQDKSTTGQAVQTSYKHLIAEYRKRLFPELESRFIRRYL